MQIGVIFANQCYDKCLNEFTKTFGDEKNDSVSPISRNTTSGIMVYVLNNSMRINWSEVVNSK